MFALFFSLYYSLFKGSWTSVNLTYVNTLTKDTVNGLGTFFTSLFNNVETPMSTLGDVLLGLDPFTVPNWVSLVSFVLALITCIGIVVMAVKGIKRVFSIFFLPIR